MGGMLSGAYLDNPITDKISKDEKYKNLICASSSMQGWRVSQEDAHNCILEYDEDAAFFAVYDGHGGHEVAQYCARKLPDFLKECEAYKKGDYDQALKDAFLQFDATLTTNEVIEILKEIMKEDGDDNDVVTDEDEENVNNLYAEAQMPLEEVMAKYRNDIQNAGIEKLQKERKIFVESPYTRARRSFLLTDRADCSKNTDMEAGPSKVSDVSEAGPSKVSAVSEAGPSKCDDGKSTKIETDSEVTSSSAANCVNSSSDEKVNGSSCETPQTTMLNGVSKQTDTCIASASDVPDEINPDSSEDVLNDLEDIKDIKAIETQVSVDEPAINGTTSAPCSTADNSSSDSGNGVTSSSTPVENGDIQKRGKGKCKDKSPGKKISTDEEAKPQKKRIMKMRQSSAAVYQKFLMEANSDSDSDSDEADETFEGDDSDDADENDEIEDEENEVDISNDSDDDIDEDDDDEDDESDDDDACDEVELTGKPGADSGCTAVVALLKGKELYVANAGDSRCVVCRGGQAVEMSLDHKPEDKIEHDRIVNAGGKVSSEGRVNNGLNLSRAIGDHAYKMNVDLPPEKQMITALPDIRKLTICDEDEFMILACDGIWNSMNNQEVVDFIRSRLQEGREKLSLVCEELFTHCLAESTLCDGSGCDNMTAIIVQFRPVPIKPKTEEQTSENSETAEIKPTQSDPISSGTENQESKGLKRPSSPSKDETEEKRPKTEEKEQVSEKKGEVSESEEKISDQV